MHVERTVGPHSAAPFPVYPNLVGDLLAAGDTRNATVAHVLATCASYCYADLETVAAIMARLGMDACRCTRIAQSVDAMYIYSTAFLVQSRCGRVAILCYRGTEPTNLGSWLGDADAGAERLRVDSAMEADALEVHRGFYRNFRATHWQVLQELALAARHRASESDAGVEQPLEALYVTGHSLGGAMAVLFALTTAHAQLRGVYTFGQPMVVCGPVRARTQATTGRKIFRHVLPNTLAPIFVAATFGVASGLIIAFAARPWVEPRLFETSARDPVVLIGVVVVIELVAVLAGWLPARRAVTVSPTEALRAE